MATTGDESYFTQKTKPPKFDDIFDLGNTDAWLGYTFSLEKTFPNENKPAPDEPCKFYLKGACINGSECPFRHTRGDKAVVCKHWLRALCKKDEHCEFLHEFRMDKMPECHFFANFGECSNPECMYRHISPEDKMKECPWYARGFCKHGRRCKHKHVRKILCESYMAGFCPDGPNCKFGHPKYELPKMPNEGRGEYLGAGGGGDMKSGGLGGGLGGGGGDMMNKPRTPLVCHRCGQPGHKAMQCTQTPPERPRHAARPLDSVTCFKCGQKGHYANKCTNKRVQPPPGGYQLPTAADYPQPGGGQQQSMPFQQPPPFQGQQGGYPPPHQQQQQQYTPMEY